MHNKLTQINYHSERSMNRCENRFPGGIRDFQTDGNEIHVTP